MAILLFFGVGFFMAGAALITPFFLSAEI